MPEGLVGSIKPNNGSTPSAKSVSKKISKNSDTIRKIAILGIVLIVAGTIFLHPGMSPMSSVRDTDGDGVVDCFDKAWLNSSAWERGYANIFVTFANMNLTYNMTYALYLDGVWKKGGVLDPQSTELAPLSVTWLYGKNSLTTFSIIVVYTSLNPTARDYLPIDARTIEVKPGESVSVASFY